MKNYLNGIFPSADVTMGDLVVFQKKSKRSTRFSIAEIDQANDFLLRVASDDDVYFGWGLQKPGGSRGRGKNETVCAFPGLMMDVDQKATEANVHAKNDHLPDSWEEVLKLVQDLGMPEPTAIVDSGNGAYFQWLFREVWTFGADAERKRMATLSKKWQGLIIREGRKRNGWELDDTSDLARITRLPGTFNHKTTPPKPVRLLEYHEDRRFTPEELEQVVSRLEGEFGSVVVGKEPNPTIRRAAAVSPLYPADSAESPEDDGSVKASLGSVAAGCAWVRSTIERRASLPEPEWYAQASIIGRCKGGEPEFHRLSKADPRYTEAETQAKLEHALDDAGPRTCENIHRDLGFDGCLSCPFWNRDVLKSPLQLGRVWQTSAELLADHVYDIASGCYIDLRSRQRYTDKSFSNKFRHRTGDATPHGLLIAHWLTRKVERTDYLPGVREFFVPMEHGEVLNLWRAGGVTPQAGDASLIYEHLEYLMPREEERSHFLNALGHAVQKPGEKLRSVLLIVGKQGTGKSFLGNLVERMFGLENLFVAESHDLSSRWTAQMSNRQVLILEELGIFEKREVYETLKRWVTDEFVTVEEKNIPRYLARTPKLMLAFSNHATPTALQEGDRRFWVCLSEATPQPSDYYRRLFKEGLHQAPAFVHDLLQRDLSSFSASAPPPMTSAKSEIIKWSRPVVQQELEAMMEEEVPPFWVDVVHAEQVRAKLMERVKARTVSIREIADALKAMGAVQLRQMRLDLGNRVRLWAWRNTEKWLAAELDEIRAELIKKWKIPEPV